jgi:hypothetical protein
LGIGVQGTNRGAAPIFELDRGCVSFGADAQLLVPAESLVAICKTAGADAAHELGRSIGAAAGRRLAGRIGSDQGAFFAEAVDALGAEIGWLGLGLLVGERWGRALVLRIDGGPLEMKPEAEPLVTGIVAGAIATWTGRDAHAAIIDRAAGRIRVFIGGARAVALARELVASGADHHEVLRRLHATDRNKPAAGSRR